MKDLIFDDALKFQKRGVFEKKIDMCQKYANSKLWPKLGMLIYSRMSPFKTSKYSFFF